MFNFDPLRRFAFPLVLFSGLLATMPISAAAIDTSSTMMPVPASLQFADGRFAVTSAITVGFHGQDDARLRGGLSRMLHRAEERTGLTFAHTATGTYAMADAAKASLVIECNNPGGALPVLGDDESYSLDVTPDRVTLHAPTVFGALHGFETVLQLLRSDSRGWYLPAVRIQDAPRFAWRGLMIDAARHWQPMEVIKRNLDGMALVKLNVFHFHLTEDQGFRVESKTFPKLHQLGSDGHYFTQDEIREIIAYAADRGIRVVPEFDIPGHATSWVTAFPELASAPGPYSIERKWGVFDPVLDPTNPKVYEVLEGFLGEMAALFPDEYMHIGGDENNGVQWNANAKIQEFIREKNLNNNAGLHAYFNTRVHAILARHGKKLIGWDEILHPDLPSGSVVHSWRGPEGIAEATKLGFPTVLSNGYYIDLIFPTRDHYLNDPVPANSPLTAAQQKLVLGGEATMWAEWVTPETIDSRIWPRTAAIAERLWSPRDVRDVPDMYRRMAIVSQRLEEAGLHHESYLPPALRRLAGDQASPADLAALRTLVDLLEPVKRYQRGRQQPGATQFTPLTGLVDCARPDSASARHFTAAVETLIVEPTAAAVDAAKAVVNQLDEWKSTAEFLAKGLTVNSPRLQEAAPIVQALAEATAVGQEALQGLAQGKSPASDWEHTQLAKLDRAAQPHAATELPIIPALKLLVVAAARQGHRENLSGDAWLAHVREIANPPPPAHAKP